MPATLLIVEELNSHPKLKALYTTPGNLSVALSDELASEQLQQTLEQTKKNYHGIHCTKRRQALALIKQHKPRVIIAEFVYSPTYGSQVSNFEALFATIQKHSPGSRFIALLYPENEVHYRQLRSGDRVNLTLKGNWQEQQLLDYLNALVVDE